MNLIDLVDWASSGSSSLQVQESEGRLPKPEQFIALTLFRSMTELMP